MTSATDHAYLVTGGAGFIGAHLVNHLMDTTGSPVTVFDHFSTGRRWAFGERLEDARLSVVEGDVRDESGLREALAGHDVVFHLAANSDIAQAAVTPDIDFWNGTFLTHNTLEAMRKLGVKRIFYTSGSGVYGDVSGEPVLEEHPRMIPISTYGASKLASEALISAYSHMFDMQAAVFRFSNVVGPHPTHGVAHDFVLRLTADPTKLLIYGDGRQSKPYIHIEDILRAFDVVREKQPPGFSVFNVASDDYLTVREIADIVVERMGLPEVEYEFTGGVRGWKADVPVYRLDTRRIRSLGWRSECNSRQAVVAAVDAMLEDVRAGRMAAKE